MWGHRVVTSRAAHRFSFCGGVTESPPPSPAEIRRRLQVWKRVSSIIVRKASAGPIERRKLPQFHKLYRAPAIE